MKLKLIMLFVLLVLGIFVAIEWTGPRPGTIVIPAGGTYLGPSSKR